MTYEIVKFRIKPHLINHPIDKVTSLLVHIVSSQKESSLGIKLLEDIEDDVGITNNWPIIKG